MTIRRLTCLGLLWALALMNSYAEGEDSASPESMDSRSEDTIKFPPSAPGRIEENTVPWSQLADVPTRKVKNRWVPRFGARQLPLHRKVQRFRGYMVPLGPDTLQHRFLLQPLPGCMECDESDVQQTIEVMGKTAISYTADPITIEGDFSLLHDHPDGYFYRMEHAVRLR